MVDGDLTPELLWQLHQDLIALGIEHAILPNGSGSALLLIGNTVLPLALFIDEGGDAAQEERDMSWRSSRSDGFSYAEVPASELAALVISATASGCGISFGTTKDRAALVITVFVGASGKEVTYARSASDVGALLSDLQTPEFTAWAKDHQPT